MFLCRGVAAGPCPGYSLPTESIGSHGRVGSKSLFYKQDRQITALRKRHKCLMCQHQCIHTMFGTIRHQRKKLPGRLLGYDPSQELPL